MKIFVKYYDYETNKFKTTDLTIILYELGIYNIQLGKKGFNKTQLMKKNTTLFTGGVGGGAGVDPPS